MSVLESSRGIPVWLTMRGTAEHDGGYAFAQLDLRARETAGEGERRLADAARLARLFDRCL